MAWSYRNDLSDEIYHDQVGVGFVEAEKLTETPESAEHAKDLLDPTRVEKREKERATAREKAGKNKEGVLTEFQEFPGQNVPRLIKGPGLTEKDHEIVKAADAETEGDAETKDTARIDFLNAERTRIRTEEQNKVQQEELDKERDKIRKEVQDDLKKSEKKPTAAPANEKK